jgi:two-component system, NarL family, sensor histidine kinase UhpB
MRARVMSAPLLWRVFARRASALAAPATAFTDQAKIPIERCLHSDLPLSKDEELVVHRVAQEALTNVIRHACASRAELERLSRAGRTALVVRDDGRGLGPRSLTSSNGIRGMRERAMLIGADFSIDSPDDGGTQVRLRIPATPGPT